MNSLHFSTSKLLFFIVSFSLIGLLIGCKKDSNEYQISYTSDNSSSYTWYSDKINTIIKSDTLLLTGQKDDKSSIAIIVSNSAVGNYELSLTDLKSIIVLDKDGSKGKSSQFISTDGVVSITEKDESKKIIKGNFEVNVVNLTNVNAKEKIHGNFTSKYTKY